MLDERPAVTLPATFPEPDVELLEDTRTDLGDRLAAKRRFDRALDVPAIGVSSAVIQLVDLDPLVEQI
jgi:hypothetical protein